MRGGGCSFLLCRLCAPLTIDETIALTFAIAQPTDSCTNNLNALRSKGAIASAVAPESVTKTWISLVGQMKAGPTRPSLLESATTITFLDCLTILR